MPITGPFFSGYERTGDIQEKIWYRQDRPYRTPLAFQHWYYKGIRTDLITGVTERFTNTSSFAYQVLKGSLDGTLNPAYQRAYDRFVHRMKQPSASLGVTIGEARSSLTMIATRSSQLLSVVKAVNRFDYISLLSAVGATGYLVNSTRKRKRTEKRIKRALRVSKTPADLFLEVSFGWKPLIQDIGAAVNVLQTPPREGSPSLRASALDIAGFDTIDDGGVPGLFRRTRGRNNARCMLGGVVTISNPNLNLANQLGFVNPALVAWQLAPLSYLIDWLIPVGRFLERYTDFVGRALQGGYISSKFTVTSDLRIVYGGSAVFSEDGGQRFVRTTVSSFPVPSSFPTVRLPVGDVLGKAQTTVAVLLQALTKLQR